MTIVHAIKAPRTRIVAAERLFLALVILMSATPAGTATLSDNQKEVRVIGVQP